MFEKGNLFWDSFFYYIYNYERFKYTYPRGS